LGSSLAFMAARRLMRERVARVVGRRRPKLRAYLDGVHAEGWKVVVLLRLGSPIPGTVLNYAAGMTGLPLLVFSCATLIGIAPQVILFVWLGMLGQSALNGPETGSIQAALLGVGVLTTVAAAAVVSRAAKARLAAQNGTLPHVVYAPGAIAQTGLPKVADRRQIKPTSMFPAQDRPSRSTPSDASK